MRNLIYSFSAIAAILTTSVSFAQVKKTGGNISYQVPRKYRIADIKVTGGKFDASQIISVSGLRKGTSVNIPGEEVTSAIKKLWNQRMFSDVQIKAEKILGNDVFLLIDVKERSRLSVFSFDGISKSDADNIREEIDLHSGMILTEDLLGRVQAKARNYFVAKGYYKAKCEVIETVDTLVNNSIKLKFKINKGKKVRVKHINFSGNSKFSNNQLKMALKGTKERGLRSWLSVLKIFKSAKYTLGGLQDDKKLLIAKYRKAAMRDAKIVSDSVYFIDDKNLAVDIVIDEGKKYYIRNISWVGNVKYRTGLLDTILGIKPGTPYNQELLDARLSFNMAGTDVSSLYQDNGYLFFQATPLEVKVDGDSVDLEIRIYEGKQARIDKISIVGNTKTNDHVILREIRTKPGDLFNRSDIIRTQRELSQLGYFDPEKMGVNPRPDPASGTVDVEYVVEEKSSDQVELTGGYGQGRLIGTLGLSFNNFSAKRIFDKKAWTPLPSGDGQRLSVRAQTTGRFYQSYNFSFTEPWLGGKKPRSLSFNTFFTSINNSGFSRNDDRRSSIDIYTVSLGIGNRLKKPDDYFNVYFEASYQYYEVRKYLSFTMRDGFANNLSFKAVLSRNSINKPLYPESGSNVLLSFKATPPFSYFSGISDYSDLPDHVKYKWLEYNKIKFTSQWFTSLTHGKNKLVLMTKVGFGFLNHWNNSLGPTPFERFYLGGSGLTGAMQFDSREIIALRGYDDQSISSRVGDMLINKYTVELRFPVSLNPAATIYALGFAEAGNTWQDYSKYSPFDMKKSAGVGVRIFLSAFGLFGLDYGWGFDGINSGQKVPGSGQFHFTLGMNVGEL